MAECKNCTHAVWELTDKGNVRRKLAGRCYAELPAKPVMLYDSLPRALTPTPPNRRPAVWFDWTGRCDLFTKKEVKP